MRTSGVICEFNPFHNGHAYLLSHMREVVGADGCVVCLMSGRFVQRGSVAIADPYLRAEAALAGGADLVLELPFPWSAGSAEHFALAGVRLMTALGIDTLAFGSECGDGALLCRAAEVAEQAHFTSTYASLCRCGRGTTAAYAKAIRTVAGDGDNTLPADFPSSNDLLAIAYLRALSRIRAEGGKVPTPVIVRRRGDAYRETTLTDATYPSATALRVLLDEAACDLTALAALLEGTMPPSALNVLLTAIEQGTAPTDNARLMPFYHTFYRLRDIAELSDCAELGGGLGGHILHCAHETATPTAFFDALRTKQYTDARLRRALMFGAVGVTEQDLRAVPTYTTLLAATARGCAFLKAHRAAHRDTPTANLIVTKPATAPTGRQQALGARADALFTLCLPIPLTAGELMRRTPTIRP